MKTVAKYIVLLAIALALVIVYRTMQEREQERVQTERISMRVFAHGDEINVTALRDQIAEIRLTPRDSSEEIRLERDEDDNWIITAPRRLEADTATCNTLASTLAGLELGGTVEDSVITDIQEDAFANFGLDEPGLLVALRYDGEDALTRLAIGDQDPSELYRYARINDDNEVLVIQDRESSLNRDLFNLRNKQVWNLDQDAVLSIALDTGDGEPELHLTRDTASAEWMITAPFEDIADASFVNSTITQMNAARAQAFLIDDPSESDIATVGLASPEETLTIISDTDAGRATLRILLGHEEDNARLAMLEGGDTVFTIPPRNLSNVTSPPDEYRDKTILAIDEADIDSWSYTADDVTISFESSGEWIATEPPAGWDAEAAVEPIANLVGALESLRAQEVTGIGDSDLLHHGLIEPRAVITIQPADDVEAIRLEIGGDDMRLGQPGIVLRRSGRDALFFTALADAGDLVLDLDELISTEVSPEATVPAASEEITAELASP